jgi:uncharacterized protein (DUF433 family)
VMVGKPVVKGTRIPVERVIAHLAQEPDLDDLFAAYPELTLDDVKACLQYAQAAVERSGRAVREVMALVPESRGAPEPTAADRHGSSARGSEG